MIGPGGGEWVRRHRVLAELPELEVLDLTFAPDFEGVAPHTHPDHVDSFYVLEGELEVTVAGETQHAHPGDLVHAAPGVVHSFKNSSPERVRFLNVHAPGMRFDEYIRKMDAGEQPDPEQYDGFAS